MKTLKNASFGKALIFFVLLCLCAILAAFFIRHQSRPENMTMQGAFAGLSQPGNNLPFSLVAFQRARSIRRDISMNKKETKKMASREIAGKNAPRARAAG